MSSKPPRGRTNLFAAIVLVAAALAAHIVHADENVVFVSAIDASGTASGAGLRVGDELVGWSFQDAHASAEGRFETALMVDAVQSRWGQRGRTSIEVRRGDIRIDVSMPVGTWGVSGRPSLDSTQLARIAAIDTYLNEGDVDAAERAVLEWRDEMITSGDTTTAAWLSGRLGTALLAHAHYDRARPLLFTPIGDNSVQLPIEDRISLLERYLTLPVDRVTAGHIRPALEQAIALQRQADDDARLAKLLADLTLVRARTGDLASAAQASAEGMQFAEAAAPDSFILARTLTTRTGLLGAQGKDDEALQAIERAIELLLALDAPANVIGGALSNRGLLSRRRGELAQAIVFFEQSLGFADSTTEGLRVRSRALNNLGLVRKDRGDLRGARSAIAEALVINDVIGRQSLSRIRNIGNLAIIDAILGNLAGAAAGHDTVTGYWQEVAPDGTEVGASLAHSARIAELRNQPEEAEALYEQSVGQLARVAPDSPNRVRLDLKYADFLRRIGKPDVAVQVLSNAVEIAQQIAPDSLLFGVARRAQADLAVDRDEFALASAAVDDALRIHERDAPDSVEYARAHYAHYRLRHRAGDTPGALASLNNAVAVLERQRSWLPGDDESRRQFSDRYREIYSEYAQLLLDLDEPEAALQSIEQYRARSLLALLSSRGITDTVPVELADERKRLRRAYTVQKAAHDAETDLDRKRQNWYSLRNLEVQLSMIEDRIHESGTQATPAPILNVDAIRPFLSSDGVGISYFMAAEELLIFVISHAGDLHAARVPVNADTIAAEIRRFRHLISEGQFNPAPNPALVESGHALYSWLIEPVLEYLRPATRLLVVPERELYSLPFAALVSMPGTEPRFLIEDYSIHSIQALSLPEALAGREKTEYELELLALASSAESAGRDEQRSGYGASLPGVSEEAAFLTRLFENEPIEVLTGELANEDAVLDRSLNVRYLHFAAHASFDRVQPLDSFIRLSPSSGDGRLAAWEIFDRLKTEAALVTLAACETGAGQLVSSEGQLSLARAFQVAGATDVLAAQWSVPDGPTSELMVRFYEHLREGLDTPRALRRAQLALLDAGVQARVSAGGSAFAQLRARIGLGPRLDLRHPYYWSGMHLIGPGTSGGAR